MKSVVALVRVRPPLSQPCGIVWIAVVIAQTSSLLETSMFYMFGLSVLVISQFFGRLFLRYQLGREVLECVYINLTIVSIHYKSISDI